MCKKMFITFMFLSFVLCLPVSSFAFDFVNPPGPGDPNYPTHNVHYVFEHDPGYSYQWPAGTNLPYGLDLITGAFVTADLTEPTWGEFGDMNFWTNVSGDWISNPNSTWFWPGAIGTDCYYPNDPAYTGYVPGANLCAPVGGLPDCNTELTALETACGGASNVEFFDEELCEGFCFSCEDLAADCDATCYGNVGYYSCDATLGDLTNYTQVPVAITESACTCNTDSCNDYAIACQNNCGGLDNVESFRCIDGQIIEPCVCGDQYEQNYADIDWTEGVLRQSGDINTTDPPIGGTNDENTENIAQNTANISDNTGEIADNTQATADNTNKIGKVLDEELSNINNTLQNIEAEIKNGNEQAQEWPTSSEIADMLDGLEDQGNSVLEGITADVTDSISTESALDQIPSNSLDGIHTPLINLLPDYTTCIPIDLSFRNHELIVGCEVADKIKAILGFLLAAYTIFFVVDTVYTEMRPKK